MATEGSSGAGPKSLIALVDVISHLVEQEASRWRTVSANPSLAASNSGTSVESTNSNDNVSELFLIKHSQFIGTIHDYFCQLEKNHACIHLAGRKVTDETSRVATSAKQISPEPLPVMKKSDNKNLIILRDEEQLMYRCSLMCAQFAVLSAPSPPEGDSPTPSVPIKLFTDATMTTGPISPTSLSRTMPTNLTNDTSVFGSQVFGSHYDNLSPQGSKEKSPDVLSSSGDTFYSVEPELVAIGDSDHDGFSMVTREMLCELVKQTFSQTEEQQLQHEHFIRINNNRRSKGEILAKELVTQLLVLENNGHIFYQPMAFFSRNCYDHWLQSEKRRIKMMLDKFWHFSLPRPNSVHQYHPCDYHRLYVSLLQKLIRYESSFGVPVTKGKDGTLTSLLSFTARRLLNEFSLRYGVGDLYCQISYLEYVSRNFSPDTQHIIHYTNHLINVREAIPKARNRWTATRKEMDMLRSAVSMLHAQCDQCLTKVERLFPDEERKLGIAALINLLSEVLSTQQSLFVKKVKPLREWLKKYLKVGINYRYERRKTLAESEVIENLRVPIRLTPVLLNVMIVAIKDEVKDYRDNYHEAFNKYLDIVSLAKEEFYHLLCADVTKLCIHITAKPETKKQLSYQMLGLLYRMNDLDCSWSSVVTPEMQSWRNHFTDLAVITMDVVTKQLLLWIPNVIELDQWELLLVKCDQLNRDAGKSKQSPSSIRPLSDASSILLPTRTPVSIAASETSAFTGVLPSFTTPLHQHDDVMTTPISSPSRGSYFSEDDMTDHDSPLHHHHGNNNGYYNNTATISFAQNYHTRSKQPPSLLVTADVHTPHDNSVAKNVANSSSIMTPVNEGTSSPHLLRCTEEDMDSTLLDSWNEAELLVPGSPDVLVDSDRNSDTLTTTTGKVASSSYKETIPSPSTARPKLSAMRAPLATKPLKSKGVVTRKKRRSQQLLADTSDSSASDIIPPASVATAPGLKPWQSNAKKVNNPIVTMPTVLQSSDPLVTMTTTRSSDMVTCATERSSSGTLATTDNGVMTEEHHILPLSNSPIDIVIMLSRIAAFCASMTKVLSPKLPVNVSLPTTDHSKLGHELSSEVTSSRQLSIQLRKRTLTIMKMFQHKLHRVMMQSLRLYADNLVSMDVCGWSVDGAKQILGDTTYDNLRLRCENGEIWGCRHEIERRMGLHSNGLPCQRTEPSNHYEPITKSMCMRINNMEALIRVLPQLEVRLEKSSGVLQAEQKIVSAHGYVSSDAANDVTTMLTNKDTIASSNSSSTASNVFKELNRANKGQPEEGFHSEASHQLCKYLKRLRHAQLLLMCHRMNQLIKPALSLLLEFQLPSYTLDRRMAPLTSWLVRHRDALSNHLYPDCFQELMQCLWDFILQDLELYALSLRFGRKQCRNKAMLILRVLSHFINVMHWKGKGLPLEHLTATDDYLVTLLGYYTKPTDRLLQDLDMLNEQPLSVDFNDAPIVVDLELVRQLRRQLHSVKKTFNGKEFVDKLLSLTAQEEMSESSANEMTNHRQPICYSSEYAIELGQYLLETGLLSPATTDLVHATPNPSEIEASADVVDKRTFSLASSYRFTEAEDRRVNIRKHQVFQAVKEKMNKKVQQHQRPLEERGRLGTLLLISDILVQRSQHERRLKDFINSNKFQEVTRELSNAHTVTCLCIVHL